MTKARSPRPLSHLEESLAMQIRAVGMQEPVREYRFAPPRRWRFDFAWPSLMVAVEVDGGNWIGGRHSRGGGQLADREKRNSATVAGWRVLTFGAEEVRSGVALDTILNALAGDQK